MIKLDCVWELHIVDSYGIISEHCKWQIRRQIEDQVKLQVRLQANKIKWKVKIDDYT